MKKRNVPMLECAPIQKEFHTPSNFREQTAVLQLLSVDEEKGIAKFLRSFIAVGEPGMTGFDPDKPGESTLSGWNLLWDMVEDPSMQVRGIFHTHPVGVNHFSPHDLATQKSFAQAFGRRFMWHVVHPCVGLETDVAGALSGKSMVMCVQMRQPIVISQVLGWVDDNLEDPVIELPLPINVAFDNGVMTLET